MTGNVPTSIEQLTPTWLTAALSSSGANRRVRDVAATPIGTGQIGSTYRMTIRYDEADAAAPPVLIAKMAAGDEAARQRVSAGYQKEVGFYSELAATVDVRTPRCWYSSISDDNTNFVLLLDDVHPSVPGVQAAGCTRGQAVSSITNLAALHAPRWNDAAVLAVPYLPSGGAEAGIFMQALLTAATEEFVDRYHDRLIAADVDTLRESALAMSSWYVSRPAPFTIIHGDYRLDNLMFGPGDVVTALDWQTVSVGPPCRDLAYFLGTSLEPELRQLHEHELVVGYHDAVVSRGVSDYDFVDCYMDYRIGHLQGPLITVLGCMYATATPSSRSDQMFLAMASRSCAAIRDLKTLELV